MIAIRSCKAENKECKEVLSMADRGAAILMIVEQIKNLF